MDAKTVAVSGPEDSPNVVLMPPLIYFLCLILALLFELFTSVRFPLPPMVRLALGFAVAGGGFWFMMQGHYRFKAMGVSKRTNKPAALLVSGGSFRLSRNPMYVGMVAFLFGAGLAAGSLWGMLAALVFFVYLAVYVVPREEAYLLRTFGEEYTAYCRSVRRWL
jgi:protein-S-isoprenylcysteine O-methyltransferase Ste14